MHSTHILVKKNKNTHGIHVYIKVCMFGVRYVYFWVHPFHVIQTLLSESWSWSTSRWFSIECTLISYQERRPNPNAVVLNCFKAYVRNNIFSKALQTISCTCTWSCLWHIHVMHVEMYKYPGVTSFRRCNEQYYISVRHMHALST